MKDRVVWLARYEGFFRHICRGIREGDEACIKHSAHFYAAMLPERAVIIPMPSHNGMATTMLKVAKEIAKLRKDVRVWDGLLAVPHESNYRQKKSGMVPSPVVMTAQDLRLECDDDGELIETPCVIDNVIVSGVTAQAAIKAIGFKSTLVFCLCKDMWR